MSQDLVRERNGGQEPHGLTPGCWCEQCMRKLGEQMARTIEAAVEAAEMWVENIGKGFARWAEAQKALAAEVERLARERAEAPREGGQQ